MNSRQRHPQLADIAANQRRREFAGQLFQDAADLIRLIHLSVADAANQLVAYANQAIELGDAVGISKEQALQWLNAQAALGHTFDTTAEALQQYTGKVDPATMSQQDRDEPRCEEPAR